MIYLILIFSFLFESAFSNVVSNGSLFTPLFFLTSLVILYPYFKNKNIIFFIVCFICGLVYDISYTGSLFVNSIVFTICGGLIIIGYNYIKYSLLTSNILNVLILSIYRFISYVILVILDYTGFNVKLLIKGIYNSIVINIIYGIFLFIVIDLISKIFKIERTK